jgi:hypothetical protein
MENINGKSRASFRWMLSCAMVRLAISISPCFAQGNRDASQEMYGLGTVPPEITTPFKCDSLDPKVCFDIYLRRMERTEGVLYNEYPLEKVLNGLDWPWNTAIDERHKSSGLIDPPRTFDPPNDWLTAVRRVPWTNDRAEHFMPGFANPKDGTRIK